MYVHCTYVEYRGNVFVCIADRSKFMLIAQIVRALAAFGANLVCNYDDEIIAFIGRIDFSRRL